MNVGGVQELVGKDLGPGGRYRVKALVARGGFGAVYRARDVSLQREVALKVLIPALLNEPSFVERFRREARAVAQLRHRHILEVYDFGEEADGMLYLVMPLIEGGTLKDQFNRGGRKPWTPAEAHGLAVQLLPALDFAHGRGIVHRDVKPANVLLDRDWAFLADFGIARMALGDSGVVGGTLTGASAIGTPEYMAPEQVAPDPDRPVDGRADLYAFGVMLYELLTGRVPFKGETTWETCYQVMQAPLPRPRELNPTLPADIEAILIQALARNRDERFASGAALEAALRSALEQHDGVPVPHPHDEPTVIAVEESHSQVEVTPETHITMSWRAWAPRLIRAARLDNSVYDEVRADTSTSALVQSAVTVGVTAALSSACLTIMLATQLPGNPVASAIGGLFGGLAGWAVWSFMTVAIGTGLFKGTATTGQMLRTAGLAQIPGLFSVVAVVPTIGVLLYLPVAVWSFIAEIGAARQTLRLATGATVATALLAGVVSTPVQWLVSYALSSLLTR